MLSNSVLDELLKVKAERDTLIDGIVALVREYAAQLLAKETALAERLENVLMDANVTYGIVFDDNRAGPMMVERAAIVQALGYADESAWLARTAEINALRAAHPLAEWRQDMKAWEEAGGFAFGPPPVPGERL